MKSINIIIALAVLLGCSTPQKEFIKNKDKYEECIKILGKYDGIGVILVHEPNTDTEEQFPDRKPTSDYYMGMKLEDFYKLMDLMKSLQIMDINDNGNEIYFNINKKTSIVYSNETKLVSNEWTEYILIEKNWYLGKNIK